jgi:hypothetical protein
VAQKQIKRIIEEAKANSGSESFEDEIAKKLNVEKALKYERLTHQLTDLKKKIEIIQKNSEVNLSNKDSEIKFHIETRDGIQKEYTKFMALTAIKEKKNFNVLTDQK